jgi:DNA-binding transcriptional regulator YhcF (GntR family)
MQFCIDKYGSTPVIRQIQEQIKLAVTMGFFRSGDTLPSIREVEKQTGINRGQIHKAYLGLKESGLVVLTRGKGAIVSTVAVSPRSMNDRCLQLSKSIVSKVRQLGVSPTAFARYLTQHAQETERSSPFIAYVTGSKALAMNRAAEISQLWQVAIVGLTPQELKRALRDGCKLRKMLVTHIERDFIRSQVQNKNIDVIPIEIHYTEKTIKDLSQIKANSSVSLVLTQNAVKNSRFIIEGLLKWTKSPGIQISVFPLRDITSLQELLDSSDCDCVVLGASAQSEVPEELKRRPNVLVLKAQLDTASLEAARIRAGVII